MISQRLFILWAIVLGLALFVPLPYYLAVVGGFIPYAAILLIMMENIADGEMVLFSLVHLAIYGVLLYWLARLILRLLMKFLISHLVFATVLVLLILMCVGLMPVFGIAHGHINWTNAYELYVSGRLK
jgi:hypothetical protein